MSVQVNILSQNALCPSRNSLNSAGYDLYSCSRVEIPPQARVHIPTGISLKMPKGIYGQIVSRTSLAIHAVDVINGVINPDHKEEIKVLIVNNSAENHIINRGEKIASIIFMKYYDCAIQPILCMR